MTLPAMISRVDPRGTKSNPASWASVSRMSAFIDPSKSLMSPLAVKEATTRNELNSVGDGEDVSGGGGDGNSDGSGDGGDCGGGGDNGGSVGGGGNEGGALKTIGTLRGGGDGDGGGGDGGKGGGGGGEGGGDGTGDGGGG